MAWPHFTSADQAGQPDPEWSSSGGPFVVQSQLGRGYAVA